MSRSRKMIPVIATVIGLLLVIGAGGIGCCNCLSWNPVTVSWTGSSPGTWNGNCGGSVSILSIPLGTAVSIDSSVNCSQNCPPSYSWSITTTGTDPQMTWTGGSLPASFTPTRAGCFAVNLNASCSSTKCRPCQLKICIERMMPCSCTASYSACCCDNFTAQGQYPAPSIDLLDWIDDNYATRGDEIYNDDAIPATDITADYTAKYTATRDNELVDELRGTRACDDKTTKNKYWATTFTNLVPPGCHIQSAELTIHIYRGGSNDSLLLGFISSSNPLWSWARPLGPAISMNSDGVFTLDLSALPTSSGTPINLLGQLSSNGFLDVAVQDDSGVDCATLEVTYTCP